MSFVLMPTLYFFVILFFVAANDNDKHLCGGNGWAPFPETRCIKLFFQVGDQSHKWAKRFCASEGGARLVTVQSAAEQAALEEYLFRQNAFDLVTLEYLWLDGSDVLYDPHLPGNNTYDNSVFRWGGDRKKNEKNLSLLTFTNWAPGQPVKPLENATCIQLHADCGKWSNEPCSKANAVVCVRKQRWSPEKVQEVVEKLVENQKNLVSLDLIEEKMQAISKKQHEQNNKKLQKTIEQLQENGKCGGRDLY